MSVTATSPEWKRTTKLGKIMHIYFSTELPQDVTPMADPRFPHPEQDATGNGDLPTYDALAAEAGPNSRSVKCPVG